MSETVQRDEATAAQTEPKPITADNTRCAACEEFKMEQRDPLDLMQQLACVVLAVFVGFLAWIASAVSAAAADWGTLLTAVACALASAFVGAFFARRNIIGQPEFAFLDARGLLHQHRRMPMKIGSNNPRHEHLVGRYIADWAKYDDESHLHERTGGTHGSDGSQFLVDGAILQLRRGGWFRRVTVAADSPSGGPPRRAWMPHRCWRGLDDLTLRSVHAQDELRLDPNEGHRKLQLINDPTSSIAQLLHDHRTLGEERVAMSELIGRERAEHHAAIAEKDVRITALEEESAYRMLTITRDASEIVDMLAHFEFGKHAVGRSRHAATLRKLLAHALAGMIEHHPNLRTSITNAYGEALACRPGDFGELMHQRAESGAKHLAEFDAIARRVEQERKAAPKDTAPPAAPPSA